MLSKKRGFPSRSVSQFRVYQNTETFSKPIWSEEGSDTTRATYNRLIYPNLFAPDSKPSSGHFFKLSLFLRQPRLVEVAYQVQETHAHPNHTLQPDPELRWVHLVPLASFHARFRNCLAQVLQPWWWSHQGLGLFQVDPLWEWGLHSPSLVRSEPRS
jgi:hypothetical protein